MDRLIYVTSNPKKVELVSRFLTIPIEHKNIDLPEIQSLSYEVIIEHKARQAYEILHKPVLVGDTGVTFTALANKLPGPLVKWFIEALGPDGLCRLLDDYDDRSAIATSCFAYFDGIDLKIVKSESKGIMAREPVGTDRWNGWSDAFIDEGHNKTWAQMSTQEQNDVSITRRALLELEGYLKNKKNR